MPDTLLISKDFFHEFLEEYLLGEGTSSYVSTRLASTLRQLDPSEVFIHIEPPRTPLNTSDKYEVWWKREWNTHYPKILADKEYSNLNRQVAVCASELITKVTVALSNETGIELAKVRPLAERMCKVRNYAKLEFFAGVGACDDLKEADLNLKEYNEKRKGIV